jgi:hypothetical protein
MWSPDDLLVETGVPMLGTKLRSFATHPAISLDQLVPPDDFYRFLDAHLDLAFVRDWVEPGYAAGGRPSIDPVVFFKLQLIRFFEGLRSERQLLLMRSCAWSPTGSASAGIWATTLGMSSRTIPA